MQSWRRSMMRSIREQEGTERRRRDRDEDAEQTVRAVEAGH